MSDRTDKPTSSRRSSGSSVWTFSILLAVASLLTQERLQEPFTCLDTALAKHVVRRGGPA